jgi:hypothetical protein
MCEVTTYEDFIRASLPLSIGRHDFSLHRQQAGKQRYYKRLCVGVSKGIARRGKSREEGRPSIRLTNLSLKCRSVLLIAVYKSVSVM